MLTVIPLVPLLGFLINALLGRRLARSVSGAVACGAMACAFVASVAAWGTLLARPPASRVLERTVAAWIASGDFHAAFSLRLDPLGSVMILIVTGIGLLIHVYSIGYMQDETDAEYARYFSYLNLFAAFMLVLVLAANFLVMFVGWEGVGLCSYLLIGFWYRKPSASDAGKKAFLVNRVGDFGFLLGILAAFVRFGTLDFADIARRVQPLAAEAAFGPLSLITLLLFVGAAGKSAQLPLHVWLPDAMEGPTPVSALIHAATMVTAGVFMIARNAVLYSHTPIVLEVVATVGVATAFLAASVGLVQRDIKRVLAYSTVSQLGYMFLAMGVGAYAAGIFHLSTHAFFKALLFLGSGAVMHALAGEQDLGRMGGLRTELRTTYGTFLVGALAISGVPLFSGFFSKDAILSRTFAAGHPALWAVGVVTSLLTALYMFRLVFLAFHGAPAAREGRRGAGVPVETAAGRAGHLHRVPRSMAVPMVILAIGAAFSGFLDVPAALGGRDRLERFLEPSWSAPASPTGGTAAAGATPRTSVSGEGGAGPDAALPGTVPAAALMGVSTAAALAGIGIATFLFLRHRETATALARRCGAVHAVLVHAYYVDDLYAAAVVRPIAAASRRVLWHGMDAGVIDRAVNGVGDLVRIGSIGLRRLQSGAVRVYAVSVLVGVVAILGYYLWR